MENEFELIQAVAKGNKTALKKLYALYSNKIYATVVHYLQNNQDAEEVTQDVFVLVYKNAVSFKEKSSVGTWIYRIAVNTSINFLKKRNRRAFLFFRDIQTEMLPFEHPGIEEENRENAALLYKAIDELPNSQKTAFILGYIEEKPRQEVAAIMDTSLKAVESLLQRAKANLKLKLKEVNPNRRKF